MPIKAVVFDMDGVLVDSEPAHQERIRQFFADHGLDVPAEQLNTLVGCSGDYFVERTTEWWAQAPRKSQDGGTWYLDRVDELLAIVA